MGKPLSLDLRRRIVACVEAGQSRRAAAATLRDLWRAVGDICDLFDADECWNYFKAAGYAHDALDTDEWTAANICKLRMLRNRSMARSRHLNGRCGFSALLSRSILKVRVTAARAKCHIATRAVVWIQCTAFSAQDMSHGKSDNAARVKPMELDPDAGLCGRRSHETI
jgi:hypothetical protein